MGKSVPGQHTLDGRGGTGKDGILQLITPNRPNPGCRVAQQETSGYRHRVHGGQWIQHIDGLFEEKGHLDIQHLWMWDNLSLDDNTLPPTKRPTAARMRVFDRHDSVGPTKAALGHINGHSFCKTLTVDDDDGECRAIGNIKNFKIDFVKEGNHHWR